ncbi:Chromodomain protein [Phytophthora megakarya]|uniref:Chromodomain protein n=1 Tax=Phytophthora megakarya TaxID=4795 RepID=A0A225VR99_9STRA|nr:Chromodomain protein [Phytophthora megakarya]
MQLHANKLRVMWVGPYRVVDESLDVNEELLDHMASQGTLQAVETIVEHRMNTDMHAYEVKVKWLGMEVIGESWEPMKTMSEDVPQLLLQYTNQATDDDFRLAVTSLVEGKSSRNPQQRRD